FARLYCGSCLHNCTTPQSVVCYSQPAYAQPENGDAKDTRIIFLIDIVENNVELLHFFRQQFERVSGFQRDAVADLGPLKILPSTRGVIRVAVGVNYLAALGDGASPPDGRVPNR